MFIKKIIISGFCSYKYCVIEPSPGINVIIGPNGSGKSNIITALEFVLTQNYHRLNEEQKLSLICQNNKEIIEAYVEIHFDNESRYFPIDDKLVTIKRRITRTIDNYYINGKLANNTNELIVFMESGGFSRDNSYYLVKQGLVSEIATSNPQKILDILRSMSGAKKFDQKKAETLDLLEKNDQLILQIGAKIQIMEEELSIIGFNPDVVESFERMMKIKKYLTSRIKQSELDELNKIRQECSLEIERNAEELDHYRLDISTIQKQLEKKKRLLDQISLEIVDLNIKFDSSKLLMKTLMNELSDLNRQRQSQDQIYDVDELKSLDSLKIDLKSEEKKLNDYMNELQNLIQKENDLNTNLKSLESKRLDFLNCIRLFESNVDSIDERNQMIIQQFLRPLTDQIEEIQQSIIHLRDETLQNLKSEKSIIQKSLRKISDEKKSNLKLLDTLKQELTDLVIMKKTNKIKLCEIMSQLTKQQKESITLANKVKEIEQRLDSYNLMITSKNSVQRVLESLKSIIDSDNDVYSAEEKQRAQHIIDGYHGQVIDYIELIKPVNLSVEVLVNNLFHHIVSDETIAIEILNEISKSKLPGSFNFWAANRLPSSKKSSIEKNLYNLCEPLISCIRNKNQDNIEVDNVIRHIFSGLYIGRSFHDCCTLFQKSQYCDFATLNGEMIDHNGVIRKLKQNQLTKFDMYQTLLENEKCLQEIRKQIDILEMNRDRILSENLDIHRQEMIKKQELTSLQNQFQHHQPLNNSESEISDETSLITRMEQIEQQIELERNRLCSNEARMSCLIEEKNFWEEKLSQANPNDLQPEIENLNEQIESIESEKLNVCQRKKLIEKTIEDLRLSIEELIKKITQIEYQQSNIESSAKKIEKIDQFEQQYTTKIERLHETIDNTNSLLTEKSQLKCEYENAIEQLKKELNNKLDELELSRKSYETLEDKSKKIDSKIQDAMVEIERAGLFSNDFLNNLDKEYRNAKSICQMNRLIRNLNHRLNDLIPGGKINYRRLDEYEEHRQAVERLKRDKETQIECAEKMFDLIRRIEQQKNDIIIRTYKQVNVNFKEIFKQLVPNGSAFLRFLKRDDFNAENRVTSSTAESSSLSSTISSGNSLENSSNKVSSTNESSFSASSTLESSLEQEHFIEKIDSFSGIEIVISFEENVEPKRDLLSLSSGQKTLVSMALILALQQVDPTPFYIFDELDQNLDSQSRKLVANILSKFGGGNNVNDGNEIGSSTPQLQKRKQFILTTFRSELVCQSDRCFGVKYSNKISQVQRISRQSALEFLSQIPESKMD